MLSATRQTLIWQPVDEAPGSRQCYAQGRDGAVTFHEAFEFDLPDVVRREWNGQVKMATVRAPLLGLVQDVRNQTAVPPEGAGLRGYEW